MFHKPRKSRTSRRQSLSDDGWTDVESRLLKLIRWLNFADGTRRKHEHAHFVMNPMNGVWLHVHINLIEAARGHEQIVKIDLDIVHAGLEHKVVRAPGTKVRHVVNDDSRRAHIKKERKRKETCLNPDTGPWLLLR